MTTRSPTGKTGLWYQEFLEVLGAIHPLISLKSTDLQSQILLKKIFFLRGPFLKSLLNLLQYFFLFSVLVFWLWNMWELSSPTTDWNCTSYVGRKVSTLDCLGSPLILDFQVSQTPPQTFHKVELGSCFIFSTSLNIVSFAKTVRSESKTKGTGSRAVITTSQMDPLC